jgi:ArsR family transcriptional regulator
VLKPGGRLVIVDMFRHDRIELQRQMGHVWLGFAREQIITWLEEAGFRDPRLTPLPPDPQARGPALFAATARRASGERLNGTNHETPGPTRPGTRRKR